MVQAMVDMEIMKCLLEDSLASSDFDDTREDEASDFHREDVPVEAFSEVTEADTGTSTQSGPKIDISVMRKIPKRPRSHTGSRSEITFRSPLDPERVESPVDRYGKKIKLGVADHSHRHSPRPPSARRDRHKNRDQQLGFPSPTSDLGTNRRKPNGNRRRVSAGRHRHREDVRQDVSEAVKKLRLPPSMLTSGTSPCLDESLIPRHHGPCFRVFTPAPPPHFPEVYTDRDLSALVKAGDRDDELINKKVSVTKLQDLFKPMLTFVTGRQNQPYWVAIRRESIASGGLQVLAAFVEEQLTWAQIITRQGGHFDGRHIDIILDTSVFTCTAFIGKLRQLHLPCVLDKRGELALVRQVAYLVAMGNRLTDACNLLGETKVNFRCGVLLALVMTVPGLQLRKNISTRAQKLFQVYLEAYRTGDVMRLLNIMVVEHHSLCHNSECSAATRAAVGSPTLNKGLFFYPVL
ncbi:multifunctional expression regulator [Colobine gammaherpesvirus 1]|uniref:Multifunctional expression regulator n=1 Tax=Colobine gammaherpesvirus 1 TaxID=2597325 RepID=A0A5B8G801_9GAMA|nr:multifunctional expression regulator [Colobine gammaherpesvirus 1]QDQ69264.1 multifunctional expression regulator [Colobine gammaherpesvirus 1]